MSLKLVIPRDPLIFRDGKPFTAVPGERSKSMPFPFPATLAGAIRTRKGTNTTGEFDKTQIESLLNISVRGPFLVELDENLKITKWYFPAPADALLVTENKTTTRYALAPLNVSETQYSIQDKKLKLIGTKQPVKAKPTHNPPLYWSWDLIQKWLVNPPDEEAFDLKAPDAMHRPARETRTHVSIDPKTQTAVAGALFQTSGMEFIQLKQGDPLSKSRQLALTIETTADFANGMGFLGGERRVIRWENVQGEEAEIPECPQNVKDQIKQDGHCRLILATPAYFTEGYLSTEFEKKYNVKIQAVAMQRYQTISGWDYAANDGRGAPKPTRRLVPAGSVYFIKFEDKSQIQNFINEVWLHSISDDEQSQRDGFGLALLGAWNGVLRKMEVKHG